MSKPHLAGEFNGRAKITEGMVREIRASNLTQREIAEQFGISISQAGSIRRGESWKHLVPESE